MLVNDPHNPTGTVLHDDDLAEIARLCVEHDVIAVTDEVYEHVTFDGAEHVPMATLPGMWERTITISSAGKTFSVTGWKVGWASGPTDLVEVVGRTSQWLTFSGGAGYQPAVAEALGDVDALVAPMLDSFARRRDLMLEGLEQIGMTATVPRGSYFVVADASPLGVTDAMAWCREMP